jgi:hypothetical protein
MIARMAIALVLLAAPLGASGDPARASSTARVGARILPAPRQVDATVVPDRIVVSPADRERGDLTVRLAGATHLAVAVGDRDEGPLEPAKEGVLRFLAVDVAKKVEIVWHAE